MNYFEWFDLLAIGLIHLGNYHKINKKSIGWLFSCIAIIYFIGRSISCGFISQPLGHMISLTLALYGFYTWRKLELKK